MGRQGLGRWGGMVPMKGRGAGTTKEKEGGRRQLLPLPSAGAAPAAPPLWSCSSCPAAVRPGSVPLWPKHRVSPRGPYNLGVLVAAGCPTIR